MFGYLHTAWTEIGFTHGDLNCANVMEHRGDADLYLPRGFADKEDKNDKNQLFKLPGELAKVLVVGKSCFSSRVNVYLTINFMLLTVSSALQGKFIHDSIS